MLGAPLLISAHMFSLADPSGQYKSALLFLFIGIQMRITGALIGGHQDERALQLRTSPMRESREETGVSAVYKSVNRRKES